MADRLAIEAFGRRQRLCLGRALEDSKQLLMQVRSRNDPVHMPSRIGERGPDGVQSIEPESAGGAAAGPMGPFRPDVDLGCLPAGLRRAAGGAVRSGAGLMETWLAFAHGLD
jgi:hypothetical protein